MKTGFNLLLWTTHVTAEHTGILKGIKKAGYDTVEIPVFEGTLEYFASIGGLLDELGLERGVVSVIGPSGKNPLSADNRTFGVWTEDWVASPHDDLTLIPRTEENVYQRAFATLEKNFFAKT